MEKPPQKVAYLSRISVVSEIFPNNAQQPKWQNSCSKMWPIEQLYMELGDALYFWAALASSLIFVKAGQLCWGILRQCCALSGGHASNFITTYLKPAYLSYVTYWANYLLNFVFFSDRSVLKLRRHHFIIVCLFLSTQQLIFLKGSQAREWEFLFCWLLTLLFTLHSACVKSGRYGV